MLDPCGASVSLKLLAPDLLSYLSKRHPDGLSLRLSSQAADSPSIALPERSNEDQFLDDREQIEVGKRSKVTRRSRPDKQCPTRLDHVSFSHWIQEGSGATSSMTANDVQTYSN